MSEDTQTQSNKDAQKTVIAFIAGLLIGGLLVWIFGGTGAPDETQDMTDSTSEVSDMTDESDSSDANDTSDMSDTEDESSSTASSQMQTGEGSITVSDQSAGSSVTVDSVVFPTDEGWIGVRDYTNDQMGSILGAARYSKEQGLIPSSVNLLRATEAGNTYAVVFYTEDGDREFNLASDVQIDGIYTTFTAR